MSESMLTDADVRRHFSGSVTEYAHETGIEDLAVADEVFGRWLAQHDAALRAEWEAEVSASRVTTPGAETQAETTSGGPAINHEIERQS